MKIVPQIQVVGIQVDIKGHQVTLTKDEAFQVIQDFCDKLGLIFEVEVIEKITKGPSGETVQ